MLSQLSIPCLHRIFRGQPTGALQVYCQIGMAAECREVEERLGRLNQLASDVGASDQSLLITFDDGWRDPTLLAAGFRAWRHLQPVLFLTAAQMQGTQELLPLPRLYEWCAQTGLDIESLQAIGLARERLKRMPEAEQHYLLDARGIPRATDSAGLLQPDDLPELVDAGWIVASHAHDHSDLRHHEPLELEAGLRVALGAVAAIGGRPWLAWPEGRCTLAGCRLADRIGFERQFSLRSESGELEFPSLLHREVWKPRR